MSRRARRNHTPASCDAALRAHIDAALQTKLGVTITPPTKFPFAVGY